MFTPNRTYNRRADLHAPYGGQQQGGISTPKGHPFIFLFSGGSGKAHGYNDGFIDDGAFRYFGEGQRGDMKFQAGNRAIRDHAKVGKSLFLFHILGKGRVQFDGEFALAAYEWTTAPGADEVMRQAIVFTLAPVSNEQEIEDLEPPDPGLSLDDLRQKALAAAEAPKAGTKERVAKPQTYRQRAQAVKQYVLKRADGVCELCSKPAPFARGSDGTPYLEPHHIRRLSDGGLDHPDWVAGVCANCHREAHYGERKEEIKEALIAKVQKGLEK